MTREIKEDMNKHLNEFKDNTNKWLDKIRKTTEIY
jgi:formiminotetrahydrofolate cyclodeaminase